MAYVCICIVLMMVSALVGCALGVFAAYVMLHRTVDTSLKVASALVQITEKEANALLMLEAAKSLKITEEKREIH